MIPKSLFAAWVAIQQMCGSPRLPESEGLIEWEHDQYPVEGLHRVNTHGSNLHTTRNIEINFEDLPSGDWDSSTVLNGAIQLSAPTATRIWSMKDAFPNIKTKYGGNHCWGAYPAGQNVTVHVVDGVRTRIGGTFGYVLNGKLAPFSWKVLRYRDGEPQGEISGSTDTGGWFSLNTIYSADTVYFLSTAGDPTGLLLVEDIVYEE